MARGAVQRCWWRHAVYARQYAYPCATTNSDDLIPCAQYSDLRQLLYAKALSLGAEVVAEARISSIEFDTDERPSIRLESGEVFEGDVVVGTDGPDSIARNLVISQDVKETNLGMTIFRSVISR